MQVIYLVKNKLLALCIISHIKRIPVTVYHLLLWSFRQRSAPSWWESGLCQDELREEMFCVYLGNFVER